MLAIDGAYLDFKQLDLLALRQTAVHRLDPRAKLLTTLCFIVCVVSFGKYEISAMLPFLVYPVALIAAGQLPPGYILRKVLLVMPFALLIGLFNPIFDRQVVMQIGGLDIWGGWLSCFSIALRVVLTATAAIILVATTGFPVLCAALEKFRIPKIFIVQLQFLYRYIFVLTDEGVRIARARQLRACDRRSLGMRHFGSLAGQLLLRTWERAERIHMAMLARGFSGGFKSARRQPPCTGKDIAFTGFWIILFILLRTHNASQLLGNLVMGHIQ
jgi:cobalt/nickel transport system permease protein